MEHEEHLTDPVVSRFAMAGDLWALRPLEKATAAASSWRPSRPLGGWLATYGKIGPDGGIVPTRDRDGHVLEAAKRLGHIHWDEYIKGGKWNDTHDHQIIVGLPDSLEFHDGTTELSKAHGKLGFWTTGHLFDRADSRSWEGLTDDDGKIRRPTDIEFARSDYFWNLAHLLKGTPRPLGLSADGLMAMTPCKSRIVWAQVKQAAVCETPVNPDATLEPMVMAQMVSGNKCRNCGACEALKKAQSPFFASNDTYPHGAIPQYGDGGKVQKSLGSPSSDWTDGDLYERVIELLMEEYFLSRSHAETWFRDFVGRRAPNPKERPNGGRRRHAAA